MTSQKSYENGKEFPTLAKGTLRLYSMRFCPYAQRTRLVLAHKNIKYETINVHLKPASAKPDWFMERNPLGMVPVLEKDGKVVYESTICNDFLEADYPEYKLLPSDPYQLAQDKMLMARFDKVTSNYYKYFGSDANEDTHKNLLAALQPFEDALVERGDFFGGKSVSMLDYNLWPHIERLPALTLLIGKQILTKEKFPKLHAYYQRMLDVPAVKACHMTDEAQKDFIESYMKGTPNFDMGLEE